MVKQAVDYRYVLSLVCVLTAMVYSVDAHALALSESNDWHPNQSEFFKSHNLRTGGWLNAGFSINPSVPEDNYNGSLGFADRANELQLNQLYLFLQRDVSQDANEWSWGGRIDFIFGSDAFFTRSMGDPANHWDAHLLHQRVYGIAFPQAYLQLQAPIGNGLRIKLGEFYTLIGNESVLAPDNFFYTRSYTMQYGEPFSHTGVLASYGVTPDVEVNLGAVTGSPFAGWDGSFQHRMENWGLLGSVNLALPAVDASLAIGGTHGTLSDHPSQSVNLYSLVYKQNWSKDWHMTLQHDYGWISRDHQQQGAQWYGVVGYLTYDMSQQTQLGLRLEWFRDDDGVRVGVPARHPTTSGHDANYYAATLGVLWRPMDWLTLRPSVRYDHSDGWNAFNQGQLAHQWLLATDVLMQF